MTPEEKLIAQPLKFTFDEACYASTEWGFNCGPAALCAVLDMTPAGIRRHLGDFETKHYANPKLIVSALDSLKIQYKYIYKCLGTKNGDNAVYPKFGLVRIQWGGPWTANNVPTRKRYRHTHWIGIRHLGTYREIFDINAMPWGGWIWWKEWRSDLVPWLLRQVEPNSNGGWWPTHCLEISDHIYS